MAVALRFTVTLDPASTLPATVTYTTHDVTAAAGTDYTSESHVLTFNVGDPLTQTLDIPVLADPNANAAKSFTVTLTNANGATILKDTGTGVISIGDKPVVTLGTPSLVTIPPNTTFNPLIAVGNQWVDSVTNTKLRLRGINWYGMDGTDYIVHGLYAGRSYKDVIDQISELGFDTLRLPFADDVITSTLVFNSTGGDLFVDPINNPEIIGMTPMQALSAVIYYCSTVGVRVLLDHHRISVTAINSGDSGFGTDGWPATDPTTGLYLYGGSSTPRPYTAATWANMWASLAIYFTTDHDIPGVPLAGKYASNSNLRNTIFGFEPHNEPRNMAWGVWAGMCEALFPVVNAIQPDWMMVVDGVGKSADRSDSYWDGGYLRSIGPDSVDGAPRPVNLGAKQNKLAYSAHEYGQSVFGQTWLSTIASAPGGSYPTLVDNTVPGYPSNLEAIDRLYWGSVYERNEAPIFLGEFGFGAGLDASTGLPDPNQPNGPLEIQWVQAAIRYFNGNLNAGGTNLVNPGDFPPSFAFFSLNPESGNPLGGLLINTDYLTVQTAKMDLLLPLVVQ